VIGIAVSLAVAAAFATRLRLDING
jgi:hypothetical protein